MNLLEIQPIVQQIADAIASVLKIEVEIANHEFIRVAGTGEHKTSVLHKMEGDLVYQAAIRTGQSVIIENPGFEEVCKRCHFYQHCPETGEICTPIFYDNRSIGVIGLLAFNAEQRKRLFENTEDILSFLQKMASLIETKLREQEMIAKLQSTSDKLARMMDLVDQGIIVLDNTGQIHELNMKARLLLGMEDNSQPPADIQQLLASVIQNQETRQTLNIPIDNKEKSFYLIKQELSKVGRLTEYLLILQAVDEIHHLAEQTSKNQMKPFEQIIGTSESIKEIKEYAFRVSQSDSTVLIQGESGTGKEVFAKAIHQSSPRKEHPFVTVNCGAIPEHLLESELFGYEKGAFTGANTAGKPGKFELANKGTIFLDEIGEMPPFLQVKLLRVLQEKEIERLGGIKPIPLDVRVIAATNQDLQKMVAEGRFREDLFFRLNVIPIMIPPLRNRKEDILEISNHFINMFNETFQANVLGLGPDVKEMMLNHAWSGNVRELRNFIEYLFNFFSAGWITLENAGSIIEKKLQLNGKAGERQNRMFSLEEMEKELIEKAILYVKKNQGNIEEASELLGIGRATLFRKIKKYQIDTKYQFDT